MSSREGAREREAAVRNLRAEGLTNDQIAQRLGVNRDSVARIATRIGLSNGRKIEASKREEVEKLGRARLSVGEIHRKTGISQDAIARILDSEGIPRRGAGEVWPGDTRFGRVVRRS